MLLNSYADNIIQLSNILCQYQVARGHIYIFTLGNYTKSVQCPHVVVQENNIRQKLKFYLPENSNSEELFVVLSRLHSHHETNSKWAKTVHWLYPFYHTKATRGAKNNTMYLHVIYLLFSCRDFQPYGLSMNMWCTYGSMTRVWISTIVT